MERLKRFLPPPPVTSKKITAKEQEKETYLAYISSLKNNRGELSQKKLGYTSSVEDEVKNIYNNPEPDEKKVKEIIALLERTLDNPDSQEKKVLGGQL